MRIPITGSRVDRVWHCPASAILPQVVADSTGYDPARQRGKDIHRYLERVKSIGAETALAEAPAGLHALLVALDLDNLPVSLATEVAFAWNWRAMTAREIGRNLDRAYERADPSLSPDEIPCTLDIVGVEAIGQGYIGDYKSGHGKYPAPDMFGQTLLGACCVRSVYGCDDVVVELIHIHDDGTHHTARRTVNEWDLDVFAAELKAAMELVEYWEAEYAAGRAVAAHEGTWCQYCDAYKACPAKVALVRSIPAELMTMGVRPDPESGALALSPGVISVRNAADVWMVLERISDVVNRAKQEVCSIAAFEEIPLPDGRVIGRTETKRRDLDGKIVHSVLEKRYGRETADGAVDLSSSIAALHQAVAKHIKLGEKMKTRARDGVEDAVIAEIDRLGGIREKVTEAVKPHVPKAKRPPSGS